MRCHLVEAFVEQRGDRPTLRSAALRCSVAVALGAAFGFSGWAQEPVPPTITSMLLTNGGLQVEWTPYPAAEAYALHALDGLGGGVAAPVPGVVGGFSWFGGVPTGSEFYRVGVQTLGADDLYAANLLQRITYGPTPGELDRVRAMGPAAFLAEQLASEGINELLDIDVVSTNGDWQYVQATGYGSSSRLYIYLTTAGDAYVDDLWLVEGSVAEAGSNLIRNGAFEAPLVDADWTISTNHDGSAITTALSHSGAASLHLVASSGGTTRDSSIWQTLTPSVSGSRLYTLSYWYRPGTDPQQDLTIRLSGSGIVSAPGSLGTRLAVGTATRDDLVAWHILHAVRSQKQLQEVLLQFLDNHFVTQHDKSEDYFGRYYDSGTERNRLATNLEYRELERWRETLRRPDGTFRDLLRISAESPAMIIYLDTVTSRGEGSRIANENYARELLELFTCGVDNGYDQADIVEMSKVWTGWRLRLVDPADEFNPFAEQSTTIRPGSTNTSLTTISNLAGVWAFNYQADRHKLGDKRLFVGRRVPDRFGARYTQRFYGANSQPGVYELVVRGRSDNTGVQEGYEALAFLADLPFTQEYLSVKLCRLLVHDEFEHGVYDYTDPNLSPEAALVRDCMAAWDSGTPRGQIRQVLQVILESDMFRSHAGSRQKVKTPLEFVVGAVRVLRGARPGGGFTAETDGYSLAEAMEQMGGMELFDRVEPDGYPEAGAGWISAGTLAERLRFAQALCMAPGASNRGDAGVSMADPTALVQSRLAVSDWANAEAVVDVLLDLLFFGEGQANLALLRSAALDWLNTTENGATASPFAVLDPNATVYDSRVRSLTGWLLNNQRMQEQ